jgi:sugar/nucleoside kinase (ribokinase family)
MTEKPGDPRGFFVIDSFADRVVDAVGAGDALLAYATLSLLVDRSEVAASILGSIAAALECEVDGNIPIGPTNVLGKIDNAEKRARFE